MSFGKKDRPSQVSDTTRPPKVLILGAGFAGLNCAMKLKNVDVKVTVVDRNNCSVFQPFLYQVALASLSPSHIARPLRTALKRCRNTTVLMDEVGQIDVRQRKVRLASGTQLEYDYLIVATGSEKSFFGHPEWEAFAPGLKTIEDAMEVRRRILLAFENAEREAVRFGEHAPLHFLIIGGGPTGVELAGALAEMADYFLSNDFPHIDAAKSKVVLIDSNPRILATYPQDLAEGAVRQLNRLGVEVRSNVRVQDVGDGFVRMTGGEVLCAAVTLWGAGVATSPVGAMLGVPIDTKGRVIVNQNLNPEGNPDVFICGDLAAIMQEGQALPGVAGVALQMGSYAAAAIRNDRRGKPRNPFRYFDKGNIATIGRYSAVGDIRWPLCAHWTGLIAWLTWLGSHITSLLGFRNRIAVIWELTSTYLLLIRGDRLILGATGKTSNKN